MVSKFIVQHNVSILVADHLGQLFKHIFPDSQIACSYACAKTKTFCIINKAFQPYYHKQIIGYCKSHSFTVGHDGSNDTGVQKMNPIAVRIFDTNRSNTNDAFSIYIGLSVEDVCVGCYYWFDRSTEREGNLSEYFHFCNEEYQAVLKHLSVRWLSLEKCAVKVLRKFPSLKSCFLSAHFSDGRFERLN